MTIDIRQITKINIGPGDFLAINCDQYLTNEAADRLTKAVQDWLGRYGLSDTPILVLEKGLSLTIVHREEGE